MKKFFIEFCNLFKTKKLNIKSSSFISKHEFVDLGLSSGTKWATCNIGAETPNDYGKYFSWGEIRTKDLFDFTTKWIKRKNDNIIISKYCTKNSCGLVDNKTVLELSDDVAYNTWGQYWRIPSKADYIELIEECKWILIKKYTSLFRKKNAIRGYKIIGPNGNNIFIPAAGFESLYYDETVDEGGLYWTNSLYSEDPESAYALLFNQRNLFVDKSFRYWGGSIRPVLKKGYTYEVKFDGNGGEGYMQNISVDHADKIIIPKCKFTRLDYDFLCWNTKIDGTGLNYAEDEIYNASDNIVLYAQWYKTETNQIHKYIDLGLSSGTMWAINNLGSNKPEDIGYIFAWGETKPKSNYNWTNYIWTSDANIITKYCDNSYYGTNDNKFILDCLDDAASVNWGSDWRMPTKEELDELLIECKWSWSIRNNIKGYTVTGPNGNHIFFPISMIHINEDSNNNEIIGGFWSNTLNNDAPWTLPPSLSTVSSVYYAYTICFSRDKAKRYNSPRCFGYYVRPVLNKRSH
jgi:hypothetical protein